MMIRYLPHLTLLFAVLFALSPLASDGFNGFTPDQFPVVQHRWPVQPAGWAFSIWGLIYLWLIAGSVWGLLKAPYDPEWQRMRRPLLVSLTVGTFWIAAANALCSSPAKVRTSSKLGTFCLLLCPTIQQELSAACAPA